MRRLERACSKSGAADRKPASLFPARILLPDPVAGRLEQYYEIDPKDSWLLAAAQNATCRSSFPAGRTPRSATCSLATASRRDQKSSYGAHRHRVHDVRWPAGTGRRAKKHPSGSSRSAAASPATSRSAWCRCSHRTCNSGVPRWGYFCQISDSTTSYGSYSGAIPNEKITWGKLSAAPEVRDRVGRHDRGTADFCLCPGQIAGADNLGGTHVSAVQIGFKQYIDPLPNRIHGARRRHERCGHG